MIYLDANATEPLRPEARTALMAALDEVGNPASIHRAGRSARQIVEQARRELASCLNADASSIVFTSGGTEANAMAIAGIAPGRPVFVGATEHDAVRSAMGAEDAVILPVMRTGALDLPALHTLLSAHKSAPGLVCVMAANNETGIAHPLAEIAAICREFGAFLHVDAVQAAGRQKLDFAALGASSMAISAHKIGGPKGIGALILAPGVKLAPMMRGGGQERGRRGGTLNVPAIAGFGAAMLAASAQMEALTARHRELRARILAGIAECGAVLCGEGDGLANTLCLALPGVSSDAQLIALDLAGICVSSGSACSAGKVGDSHVLTAMGLGEFARSAIRVSMPWSVSDADVKGFCEAYRTLAARTAGCRV